MKFDLGAIYHALAGVAIGGVMTALMMPGWALVLGLAIFGYAREAWQHDFSLTRHQWIEAMAWSVGGCIGYALARWVL